jgi:TolB protein
MEAVALRFIAAISIVTSAGCALFSSPAGESQVVNAQNAGNGDGASGQESHDIIFQRDGDLFAIDPAGTSERAITSSSDYEDNAAYSPDGHRIVYESIGQTGADWNLFVAAADGSRNHPITSFNGFDNFADWSGSNLIAFVRIRQDDDDIYVIRPTGNGLRRVVRHSGMDREPSWSPNSTRIAFTSERSMGREIFLLDLDGGRVERLTNTPRGNVAQRPRWSPNGRWILYEEVVSDSETRLHLIRPTGERDHTVGQVNDARGVWSPDGRRIAFTRYTRGGQEATDLMTMRIDGSHRHQLGVIGIPNDWK